MKYIIATMVFIGSIFAFTAIFYSDKLYADSDISAVISNEKEYKSNTIAEYIDDVQVPGEVISYIHITYQGHAITQIITTTRNGEKVYILKVSTDSYSAYENSIFLVYNKEWKLIGDEKLQPPPPTAVSVPDPNETTTENEAITSTEPLPNEQDNSNESSADVTVDNTDSEDNIEQEVQPPETEIDSAEEPTPVPRRM